MTNPLDMPGPEFLVFYIVYGACVFTVLALLRAAWGWTHRAPTESLRWRPGVYPPEGDAYTMALLRGGPKEVALAVIGRLVAEGFLVLDGTVLRQPSQPATERARLSPLEEEALAAVAPGEGGVVAEEALRRVVAALEPRLARLREELEAEGLAPGESQRWTYRFLGLAALVLVPGLGLLKLLVAMARGKSNVGFLILLLCGGTIAAFCLMRPPRQTAAGKRYLAWLKESHQGLVSMVSAGRRQGFGELALVAGIFGLDALPALAPLKQALLPPPDTGSSASGCGSDSSGCGGGGGCGGGCGGCGG